MIAGLRIGGTIIARSTPDLDALFHGSPWPELGGQTPRMRPEEITAAMATAWAEGARAFVLALTGCPGGDIDSAFDVIAAMRRFSDAGGLVVAHVHHLACSSAPLIVQAADVVVVDPVSLLVFHSVHGQDVAGANARWVDFVACRSAVPRETLESWAAKPAAECSGIDATRALALGLADLIGPEQFAGAIAQSGMRPASVRQVAIGRRA